MSNLEDTLRGKIKLLLLPFGYVTEDTLDQLMAFIDDYGVECRVETADWAVHFVDKIELENPAPDDMWRTFKFIRNGMRDEFKRVHGVDPSPKHDPLKAQLRKKG